eukprot:scaffold941_cov97-Isochrysis_galbana.AAC.1
MQRPRHHWPPEFDRWREQLLGPRVAAGETVGQLSLTRVERLHHVPHRAVPILGVAAGTGVPGRVPGCVHGCLVGETAGLANGDAVLELAAVLLVQHVREHLRFTPNRTLWREKKRAGRERLFKVETAEGLRLRPVEALHLGGDTVPTVNVAQPPVEPVQLLLHNLLTPGRHPLQPRIAMLHLLLPRGLAHLEHSPLLRGPVDDVRGPLDPLALLALPQRLHARRPARLLLLPTLVARHLLVALVRPERLFPLELEVLRVAWLATRPGLLRFRLELPQPAGQTHRHGAVALGRHYLQLKDVTKHHTTQISQRSTIWVPQPGPKYQVMPGGEMSLC